ncbi:hypothetical protein KJ966_27545 [bacterium]|nr:hypothetical protein [bacterium]
MKSIKNTNLKLKLKTVKNTFGFIALFLIMLHVSTIQSKADGFLLRDYNTYFSEFDNILLYKPGFIKDIFHGLIDLKGNATNSKNHINFEVLGCFPDSRIDQACRIDQLTRKRRTLGIRSTFEIPLDFTHISARNYNKQKKIVSIKWKPDLITPPHMSVKDFLTYLNAAEDSKYYSLKKGIDRIQLNAVFDREANIIIENSFSDNLLKLYQLPKTDKRDSLIFAFDYIVPSIRNNTVHFFIHFKVNTVIINHQTFTASELRM